MTLFVVIDLGFSCGPIKREEGSVAQGNPARACVCVCVLEVILLSTWSSFKCGCTLYNDGSFMLPPSGGPARCLGSKGWGGGMFGGWGSH